MINTLLATNSPTNATANVIDLGHNLSSDSSCVFSNASSLNNTDPKLARLADNGGPVPTMRLLTGSPAIDAGDNASASATDARGFPRPLGAGVDIGAFEFGAWVPAVGISLSQAGVDIIGFGTAGQTCRLLVSTNLSAWVAVSTSQMRSDGTAVFQDKVDPAGARRFYRVSSLGP